MIGQKLTYIRYKTNIIMSLFIDRINRIWQMYVDIQVINVDKEKYISLSFQCQNGFNEVLFTSRTNF